MTTVARTPETETASHVTGTGIVLPAPALEVVAAADVVEEAEEVLVAVEPLNSSFRPTMLTPVVFLHTSLERRLALLLNVMSAHCLDGEFIPSADLLTLIGIDQEIRDNIRCKELCLRAQL